MRVLNVDEPIAGFISVFWFNCSETIGASSSPYSSTNPLHSGVLWSNLDETGHILFRHQSHSSYSSYGAGSAGRAAFGSATDPVGFMSKHRACTHGMRCLYWTNADSKHVEVQEAGLPRPSTSNVHMVTLHSPQLCSSAPGTSNGVRDCGIGLAPIAGWPGHVRCCRPLRTHPA